MNDIRIPDWQSRGRGFVSLILQSGYTPGVYNGNSPNQQRPNYAVSFTLVLTPHTYSAH